jgi:hypothetical protein
MNGELAQLIALTAYGNAFLHRAADVSVMQGNSTFRFVESMSFLRERSLWGFGKRDMEVARNTAGWFGDLHSRQAQRLWLVVFSVQHTYPPPHIAVAFAGGSGSAIQADFPDNYELWMPRWEVGQRDDPESRIWKVTYKGLPLDNSVIPSSHNLDATASDLLAAIVAAENFASRAGEDARNWAEWFRKAANLLASEKPLPPSDILPKAGYSLKARQIFASAAQAFVFGGMGSWNDLYYEDATLAGEYDRVTRLLYQSVMNALVVSANAFDVAA